MKVIKCILSFSASSNRVLIQPLSSLILLKDLRCINIPPTIPGTAATVSPRTAHRIVGYFEEEAVISYTQYLEEVESGKIENVKAPKIAIDYWNLPLNSTLKDVIKVVRDDEAGHRDLNHSYANILNNKEDTNEEQLQH